MTNHEDPVRVVAAEVNDVAADPPLQVLTSLCGAGTCPTVYRSADGTLVVQGRRIAPERAGVDVPEGEVLVAIPAEILKAALRELQGDA